MSQPRIRYAVTPAGTIEVAIAKGPFLPIPAAGVIKIAALQEEERIFLRSFPR